MDNAANEIKWPSFGTGEWPASNDYFTLINAGSINSRPSGESIPVANWIRNTASSVTAVTSFEADSMTTGSSIPNAVIRSESLIGSDYSGIALFIDPCGGNPKGDFYNLGVKAITSGQSDGSGSVVVSP